MTRINETDVVVVGSGCAGMRAAYEAAKQGLDVTVVEKAPSYGGTSVLAGGLVHAAGTDVQKRLGIEDDPERMAELLLLAGEDRVDERLVRDMCTHSAEHIAFLESLGVTFDEVTPMAHLPYGDPGLIVPRVHSSATGARGMFAKLHRATLRLGVHYLYGAEACHLQLGADGSVRGIGCRPSPGSGGARSGMGEEWALMNGVTASFVEGEGAPFEPLEESASEPMPRPARDPVDGSLPPQGIALEARRGVVLATGGMDQNPAMARMLNHQQYWDLDNYRSYAAPTNTGDGVRMGLEAGAAIAGFGGSISFTGRLLAGVNARTPMMAAVFVNRYGRRFVCEDCTYSYVARALYRETMQTRHPCYTVFGASSLPYGPFDVGSIEKEVIAGTAWKGATVEELARQIGVDATSLGETVERWNRDARQGADSLLDRASGLAPIEPPFYAFVEGAMNLGGLGGLLIDESARVLDFSSKPIPRLYAAGMASAGWIGPYYPGSGIALLGGLHWGWRAGQSVARL